MGKKKKTTSKWHTIYSGEVRSLITCTCPGCGKRIEDLEVHPTPMHEELEFSFCVSFYCPHCGDNITHYD